MKQVIMRSLFTLVFIALGAGGALAQSHEHHHEHQGHHTKPTLNNGVKWDSDAPLRKGMDAIRSTLQSNLHKVHEGKVSESAYQAMGKQIDKEISYIFANCKLPHEADQVLHGVLESMMNASKQLQGPKEHQKHGFLAMVKAVNEYGNLFKHSGWKPIAH